MSVSYEKKEVWIKCFGDKPEGVDYSGRVVKYNAYNNRSSRYGWNVDHIRPISDAGRIKYATLSHVILKLMMRKMTSSRTGKLMEKDSRQSEQARIVMKLFLMINGG